MVTMQSFELPEHFGIEPELREQLGDWSGYQRCIEGVDELLLIVHEVPEPGASGVEWLPFWKRQDGSWVHFSGPGTREFGELLDRYEQAIDWNRKEIEAMGAAARIYEVQRRTGPMLRSIVDLGAALEGVLRIDPDDRRIRDFRDRSREIERLMELLDADARMAMEFRRTNLQEKETLANVRLAQIVGFFLPMLALGAVFGMNVNLPGFVKPLFWLIFLAGLATGSGLAWRIGRDAVNRPQGDDR